MTGRQLNLYNFNQVSKDGYPDMVNIGSIGSFTVPILVYLSKSKFFLVAYRCEWDGKLEWRNSNTGDVINEEIEYWIPLFAKKEIDEN